MSQAQTLEQFIALHKNESPLLLGNVWDAHTTKLAQDAGYKAIGTSSHAIAIALGYADGENISLEELLCAIKRVVAVSSIPVSVDFEAGYSTAPNQVADNVKLLTDLGVVGINLEDGMVKDGTRVLEDAAKLVDKIKAIKKTTNIFINARVDTYTTKHPQALEESINRALLYKEAGADGIFVPLIETEADIKAFTEKVDLPLNVFTTAKLPAYDQLGALGVKRVSHGGKQFDQLMKISKEIFEKFIDTKDYKVILGS